MCVVIVALDVLSCRGLISCCFAPATHIHRDYWHKGMTLKQGCRCTALLLLCCCCILSCLAAGLSGRFLKEQSTARFDRTVCV